jgi:nucleoid-associated protein YgaU
LIDNAIAQQNDWLENRRTYTRGFLKSLNVFAKKSDKNTEKQNENPQKKERKQSVLAAYWFPILCALVVILIAMWVAFVRTPAPARIVIVPEVPVPVVQKVEKKELVTIPEFDIVRIAPNGDIIIAGRWIADKNISIVVNNQIIATERTNSVGEFTYTPNSAWKAGNYTVSLLGADPEIKSNEKVFLYISEHGADNSVSLLMTKDGSTLLQSPSILKQGDLAVSKIDYLDTGRIVVTGTAMPRLRVSLALDGKPLGFARVSDFRNFGIGADVGDLESGKEYVLKVRLHDGDGRIVATVLHKFVMPEMTGDEDTYYTVRRGDCLWIIARNFMRRGVLFSIIVEKNNIENPDLIYPKQVLQIPVSGK